VPRIISWNQKLPGHQLLDIRLASDYSPTSRPCGLAALFLRCRPIIHILSHSVSIPSPFRLLRLECSLLAMTSRLFQLEYPVTRPFTLPYLNVVLLVLGIIWALFVTLFNVAAVAYLETSITSSQYNLTETLWYERMFPMTGWFDPSRQCSPNIIHPNDCIRSKAPMGPNTCIRMIFDGRPHPGRRLCLFVVCVLGFRGEWSS
jgi:hypothetical protein